MTATEKILSILEHGGKLSQRTAYRLGTIRLGGIIFALRRKGYKIKTKRRERGMAVYSMKKARRR